MTSPNILSLKNIPGNPNEKFVNKIIYFDVLSDEEKIVKIRTKMLKELNDILNKENTRKKEWSYFKKIAQNQKQKMALNIWILFKFKKCSFLSRGEQVWLAGLSKSLQDFLARSSKIVLQVLARLVLQVNSYKHHLLRWSFK